MCARESFAFLGAGHGMAGQQHDGAHVVADLRCGVAQQVHSPRVDALRKAPRLARPGDHARAALEGDAQHGAAEEASRADDQQAHASATGSSSRHSARPLSRKPKDKLPPWPATMACAAASALGPRFGSTRRSA